MKCKKKETNSQDLIMIHLWNLNSFIVSLDTKSFNEWKKEIIWKKNSWKINDSSKKKNKRIYVL